MGNNFSQKCDFCPEGPYNHTTEHHRCKLCKKVGDHAAYDHKDCKYCLEDHKTEEHLCSECGMPGHDKKDHKCIFCPGPHQNHEHKCFVCGETGHHMKEEDHPYCNYCADFGLDKAKFTHDTDGHLKTLDIGKMSVEERMNWRFCNTCCKVTLNNDMKCSICHQIVESVVKCPRPECNYTGDNILTLYCPLCGELVTCRSCGEQIDYTPMYDSDDDHAYCGNIINGGCPDEHKSNY